MSSTGLSILIVEDEQPIRSLLSEILSPRFQCSTVGSASEAIRLIESRFFNLALVDLGLPGMSGLSLCRLIANRSPGTVIIVVSGTTDEQSVAEALKAGASFYLAKPFNLSELLLTVERALGRNSPGAVA